MSRELFRGMLTSDTDLRDDIRSGIPPSYWMLTINHGMKVQFWQMLTITGGAAKQLAADLARYRNRAYPRNAQVTVSLFAFDQLREALATYSGEPEKHGAFHPDNPSPFWQAALIFRDFEVAANAPMEDAL